MYLKQMSPVQKAVITHLKRLGHYHGLSLRKFNDSMLDYLVTRIIMDELPFYRPKHHREYELYNGRQGSGDHKTKWFKDFLKEREKWQVAEHGKMVALGRGQTTQELTKRNLMTVGIEFGGKIKRLEKAIEKQMMINLNLLELMDKEEYFEWYLKNCKSVLY